MSITFDYNFLAKITLIRYLFEVENLFEKQVFDLKYQEFLLLSFDFDFLLRDTCKYV